MPASITSMNRQSIFEQHAHESNWHRCLMLDWEEDAVILRCPGEPHEIPGGGFGFPGDSIYSKWQGSRLSHEEVTALEKLLHFTPCRLMCQTFACLMERTTA